MIHVNKIIIFTSIIFISTSVFAKNKKTERNQFSEDSFSFRNPFIPQLPKEKEGKKEVVVKKKPKPKANIMPLPKPIINAIPSYNLTGFIWNSDRPQAIINGVVVEVGDTIQGSEILSINKTGVEIKYMNEVYNIIP